MLSDEELKLMGEAIALKANIIAQEKKIPLDIATVMATADYPEFARSAKRWPEIKIRSV